MAKSDPKKGSPSAEVVKEAKRSQTTKSLPTFVKRNRNHVITSEFERSSDPVRNSLEKYWVNLADEIRFQGPAIPDIISIKEIQKKIVDILNFEDGNIYKGISQTFTVSDSSAAIVGSVSAPEVIDPTQDLAALRKSEDLFSNLEALQESGLIETIEIYNFNSDNPIEYPTKYESQAAIGNPDADISFIYNYGLSNYEQFSSDDSVSETQLLNYYNDYEAIDKLLNNAIARKPSSVKSGPTGILSKLVIPATRDSIDKNMISMTEAKKVDDNNIIVMDTSMEQIDSKNNKILSLPFYNKIEFGHSKLSGFREQLSSNIENLIFSKTTEVAGTPVTSVGIYDSVANYCLQLTSPGGNTDFFNKRGFTNSFKAPRFKNTSQTEVELIKEIGQETLFLIDAYAMAENLYSGDQILNTREQETTLIGGSEIKIGKSRALGLRDEIESLFDEEKNPQLQNSYEDIIDGKSNFYMTNTILYKISKFDEDDLENPIQNIFLPNVNNDKKITYIDSQVKYGKKYVYKIFAYKFISGTNYTLSVAGNQDMSAYAEYLQEYEEQRSEITVEQRETARGYTFTTDRTFDYAYDLLISELNGVIAESIKNIDSGDFSLTGTKKALVMLKEYFIDSHSITILAEIEDRLSSSSSLGLVIDSGFLSSEMKDKLIATRDLIKQYGEEISSLIFELSGLTSILNKNGLGKTKSDRKNKAQDLQDKMEQFLETEEDMLSAIAGIMRSDVDGSFNEKDKNLTAFTYPVIKMVEIPYYEDAGAILDNPPMFPDINFVPYKGNSRNISFFISSGVGSTEENPVLFNEDEALYYDLWRESKKYNQFEPIPFLSDEVQNLGASFEIYRLSDAPNSYEDFYNKNSLYQIVSENFKGGTTRLPSVSFMEKIRPNKTYYYIFRQRDSRGVVSNPTAVFSVLLVDEGGLVFPIIEQYEFPEKEREYKRSMRKLLNITPSINQITPRQSESGTYSSYSLLDEVGSLMGLTNEGIFGKTFKVRFTSKKTGKQIDLNVTFKTELASD